MNLRNLLCAIALVAMCVPAMVRGADEDLRKEIDKLKKDLDAQKSEVEGLKKEKAASKAPIASAQAKVDNKYGPNSNVTTKAGKLTMSGLVQVWYYSIQNDTIGFYGDVTPTAFGGGDTNEGRDNDSFTIRRAELKFNMDITENVTATVMLDPSRAVNGRPAFPTNVGIFSLTGVTNTYTAAVKTLDNTAGARMFQDAFVNYHGVVPHHDFQIGQYKPYFGEEGIRSSGALDFCERSMLGQLGDKRDLGLTTHGTWWDDRFQYWLGAFNSAGNFYFDGGVGNDAQNRVDDNDDKDFVWRVLIRPVWKNETWGSLEIGGSGQHGVHGEATPREDGTTLAVNGAAVVGPATLDGLNRRSVHANRYSGWVSYAPGGPVKGLWFKGEYLWMEDRLSPGSVAGILSGPSATGVRTLLNGGFASAGANAVLYRPNPTSTSGFYVAAGYKISDSKFKDSAPGWLKNFEFLLRYEEFGNILVADLVNATSHVDVFSTKVWTGGINYYIKGNNAKIQINYNVVNNPDNNTSDGVGRTGALGTINGPLRNFHAVKNDNLVVNFQVSW